MSASRTTAVSPALAGGCGLLMVVGLSLCQVFILESPLAAQKFFSTPLWTSVLATLGGQLQSTPEGPSASASLSGAFISILFLSGVFVLCGAALASRHRQVTFRNAVSRQILSVALWGIPAYLWTLAWLFNSFLQTAPLLLLLVLTVRLAISATLAGWIWGVLRHLWDLDTGIAPPTPNHPQKFSSGLLSVCCAMGAYVVIFVTMNWGLWWNLQIPHGDSSMYEEHLWNLLHGKGFRSYLDQGLFLGEHMQVIHLLLIPLYMLWPSHLLLEMCESIALALTALPAYFIARRHSGSDRAAALVAIACLFYFPLHYLDISIDLKTFRPSSFGIPALLWAIDAAERRRWGWMTCALLLTLSSQEDFAVTIAPWGLWLLWDGWLRRPTVAGENRPQMIAGGLTCLLATAYVLFAVKVAIPWFRQGATVHYARYFQAFGETPTEIVRNILLNPALLWTQLATAGTFALFFDLLLPLGMPLRAWTRLLVALPLFILLCLNELTRDYPGPFHHFHAPLIPILIWAACGALESSRGARTVPRKVAELRGLWILCCAGATAFFFSMAPVGLAFWDAGSSMYWKRLYIPDERARQFAKIPPLIPQTARVASTDFVHPRFTHYERSYDYSHYPRKVADYQDKVPDDTDYIVIDTGHRYSEIHRPEDVREFHTQPDQWEQVPIDTHGDFIVLKRVRYPHSPESVPSSKSGSR